MAQKLTTACEGDVTTMTTINCADTESEAHDNAAFDEATSQLEEPGYLHEVSSDGVAFSRAETAVGYYDPEARIAAAAFLGLSGTAELGSLDQVIDVAAYKGFNRCPVLVCSKIKGKGAKNICHRLCANPSKFRANGGDFYGVHKYALKNYPALSSSSSRGGQGIRLQNGRGRL
jgi:hypothetical protein